MKQVFKAMFIGKIVMIPNDRELALHEKSEDMHQLLSEVFTTRDIAPEIKEKIAKVLQDIRDYKGQGFDAYTKAYFGEV